MFIDKIIIERSEKLELNADWNWLIVDFRCVNSQNLRFGK